MKDRRTIRHRAVPLVLLLRVARYLALMAMLGLVGAQAAQADGGKTIASATPIVFGEQEFGNSANGASTPADFGDTNCDEYWALAVTAGDAITINWEGQSSSLTLNIYPVGTTDYNLGNANTVTSQQLNANNKNQLKFTATRTGTMVVDFQDGDYCGQGSTGPYDFTAYVKHAVRLAVPKVASLSTTGHLRISVHDPDGEVISTSGLSVVLQIHVLGASWLTIGATYPVNGTANVAYKIPRSWRGLRVSLRARATGAAYVTENSGTESVIAR